MGAITAPAFEPNILPDVAPYWEGANQGKLLIKLCKDCGKTHWYPRAICPHCFSTDTVWIEASGKGVIYSFSTMSTSDQTYTLAYITLAEGVTVMSNIVGCQSKDVSIGLPVCVTFVHSASGQAIPVFIPVEVLLTRSS